MSHTINDETAAVIEAVLATLDIPYPATVGDEPSWLRCLSDRVMHLVMALGAMRENTAEPEWHLSWLRERLAAHPPTHLPPGRLTNPTGRGHGPWDLATRASVPLYRTRDLDARPPTRPSSGKPSRHPTPAVPHP